MMFLSKQKRVSRMEKKNKSNPIAAGMQQRLILWAMDLQNYSKQFSPKALTLSLMTFCLLSVTISTYVIISGISSKKENTFSITPIRLPPHALDNTTLPLKGSGIKRKDQQLEALENYLNHLNNSPSGRIAVDRLATIRPSLLDSMFYLKNLYQQTKK